MSREDSINRNVARARIQMLRRFYTQEELDRYRLAVYLQDHRRLRRLCRCVPIHPDLARLLREDGLVDSVDSLTSKKDRLYVECPACELRRLRKEHRKYWNP